MKLAEWGGGPVLSWEGKRKPEWSDFENPQPAVLMETIGSSGVDGVGVDAGVNDGDGAGGNLLFEGDNLAVMARLLADGYGGKVQLAYLDPPFGSGANYAKKIRLRGSRVGAMHTGGSADSRVGSSAGRRDGRRDGLVGFAEDCLTNQLQYTDQWSESSYLQFMYERLWLVRELLSDNGSLYLHLDSNQVHAMKLICDEIFGAQCFQRQIIWRIGWISGYKTIARNWIRNHDTILFYCKDPDRMLFNKIFLPYQEGYVRRDGKPPTGKGYPIEDTWNCSALDRMDSIQIKSFSREKTSYPTQKNESLLERIILASSNPGDLVLDVFSGSGTTAAVAQKTGRRWIVCDENERAVQIINRRLQTIMEPGQNPRKATSMCGNNTCPAGTENQADVNAGSGGIPERADEFGSFSIWKMADEEKEDVDVKVNSKEKPAVSVNCLRKGPDVAVEITGYRNPAITGFLAKQSIEIGELDWRAIVNWVSLDRNYNGKIFNVFFSDIPGDLKQCVKGSYLIPDVRDGTSIALKIIDVCGDETLWIGTA